MKPIGGNSEQKKKKEKNEFLLVDCNWPHLCWAPKDKFQMIYSNNRINCNQCGTKVINCRHGVFRLSSLYNNFSAQQISLMIAAINKPVNTHKSSLFRADDSTLDHICLASCGFFAYLPTRAPGTLTKSLEISLSTQLEASTTDAAILDQSNILARYTHNICTVEYQEH